MKKNETEGNKLSQFKLVLLGLLGDSAVGKSSLVLHFAKGQFNQFQECTVGAKSLPKSVTQASGVARGCNQAMQLTEMGPPSMRDSECC
ncbi:hypothetical protein AMELA_G00169750 [Ameiurus melas]|uniref:Uncharacterized protein n=1 Tax=Ameiurus melas TaxID=219545 RepID=A0A7J6AG02_AMEME|nr:hypothetical protein AMELA_G00169750 [Ameiurus melas]